MKPNFFYALILLSVLTTACSESVKIPEVPAEAAQAPKGPTQITLKPEQEKEIGIVIGKAEVRPFPVKVASNGQVKAAEDLAAHVSTPVAGRVTSVSVQLGQSVRQGQTLAILKSDSIGQEMADLLQSSLQTDSDIHQAQLQLKFSEAAYQREQKLFKDRISARADLEAARTQYEKDKGALQSLQTRRSATISTIQERLSLSGAGPNAASQVVATRRINPFITISAPRAGIVVSRTINNGELADPSKEMFQIAELDRVWLVAGLYEKDLAKVRVGQPVSLTLDSLSGQSFPGRISFIGSEVDAQTRTLPIRVEVPNPGLRLKPGMFARVQIEVANSQALAVPKSALQQNGDFTFVYVPIALHQYEERRVTPGLSSGNYVQILSGLKPGEKVATAGTLALKGEALKIVKGIN
ncbi:MAG: efflux RND transporter periplasmic adaptor subunit [Gloeobacterales cyanobacterium]